MCSCARVSSSLATACRLRNERDLLCFLVAGEPGGVTGGVIGEGDRSELWSPLRSAKRRQTTKFSKSPLRYKRYRSTNQTECVAWHQQSKFQISIQAVYIPCADRLMYGSTRCLCSPTRYGSGLSPKCHLRACCSHTCRSMLFRFEGFALHPSTVHIH